EGQADILQVTDLRRAGGLYVGAAENLLVLAGHRKHVDLPALRVRIISDANQRPRRRVRRHSMYRSIGWIQRKGGIRGIDARGTDEDLLQPRTRAVGVEGVPIDLELYRSVAGEGKPFVPAHVKCLYPIVAMLRGAGR